MRQLIDITDAAGAVQAKDWLLRAEAVHRQLRPQLPSDYAAAMQAVFAGGARMTVASDGEQVVGVAVWRLLMKTSAGLELYVDDLVTADAVRSSGVGAQLLARLEAQARASGCTQLTLDSGTQRERAHRFYFREGMTIAAYHFVKPLR